MGEHRFPGIARADAADLLTVGQETFHRGWTLSAWGGANSGDLLLSYFTARKSESFGQGRVITGSQAAAPTPTLNKLAVFSIDPVTGDGTRIAVTAHSSTLFAGTYTTYVRSFLAAADLVAGRRYAFASLCISAGAMPYYNGDSGNVSAEIAFAPRLAGIVPGQADVPANFLGSAVTPTAYRIYGALIP